MIRLEKVWSLLPFGVIVVGHNGRFLFCNDTFANWLGYTRQELELKVQCLDLIAEEDRKKTREAIVYLADETAQLDDHFYNTYIAKDGHPVRLHWLPLKEQHVNGHGIVGVCERA